MMTIAPNSRARKGGKKKGEYEGIMIFPKSYLIFSVFLTTVLAVPCQLYHSEVSSPVGVYGRDVR